MRSIPIVLLAVVAAIAYGIAHDLVTAHLCVEYFTIGHPRVFDTDDPVRLALGWGVIATWWMGLLLGIPLAIAARAGGRPKRTALQLVVPIGKLCIVMALCALVAGALGFTLASQGIVVLLDPLASRIPDDRHVRFIAALWMHLASYAVGAVGGLVLALRVWRGRR